jgi:hypothetical protein
MKAGIGYSKADDSYDAGVAAARTANEDGGIKKADLVFAFCTALVDHDAFYSGIRSVVGETTQIIGGSAIGVITNNELSYGDNSTAVASIESPEINYDIRSVGDLKVDEEMAGKLVAERFSNESLHKLMLLFYDSIKTEASETSPPVLNASLPLLRGMENSLSKDIPIFGAGVIGDYNFSQPILFSGSTVVSDSVVAVLLSGGFNHYSSIMHGCTPKDGIYYTITKMDGQYLFEVDGRPVVEMINEAYGSDEWQKQNPVGTLTIGVNHGDKFGEFNEGHYVNRLISGTLPDGEGIVLFEPDLEVGTEIQFMLRDSVETVESAKKYTEDLMNRISSDGKKPVFGLYIDCAGRAAGYSNTLSEEASEVQKVFNKYDTPLLGFYSGVEIAPLMGKSRGLDWTGVLLVLTEE